jgi:short subunit fatty acids transporter
METMYVLYRKSNKVVEVYSDKPWQRLHFSLSMAFVMQPGAKIAFMCVALFGERGK